MQDDFRLSCEHRVTQILPWKSRFEAGEPREGAHSTAQALQVEFLPLWSLGKGAGFIPPLAPGGWGDAGWGVAALTWPLENTNTSAEPAAVSAQVSAVPSSACRSGPTPAIMLP